MGADAVEDRLFVAAGGPPRPSGAWACDPMHGNVRPAGGRKTRHFEDICAEIAGFVRFHRAESTGPVVSISTDR
jgi:3-deoxy-D-arabino-heptulosonate 7-phosphate (DAHP) synthase class II